MVKIEDLSGLQIPGLDSMIALSVMLIGSTVGVWYLVKLFIWIVRKIWNVHIVGDFPYPDECFDCDKGSCNGCELKGGDYRTQEKME